MKDLFFFVRRRKMDTDAEHLFILLDKRRLFIAGTFPYLEDFSVGVKHIYGHLDVLLNAFPSPLKISSLQCQVQVVTDVTWTSRDMLIQTNMCQTPAHMVALFVKMK